MTINSMVAGVVLNARNTMKSPALISSSLAIVIASNACAIDSLRLIHDPCGYRWIQWNAGAADVSFRVMRSCETCPGGWQVLEETTTARSLDEHDPAASYRVIALGVSGAETGALTIEGDGSTMLGVRLTRSVLDPVVTCGSTVTFSVTANTASPVSYTWMRNNSVITGQTGPSLVVTVGPSDHRSTYSVLAGGCELTRTSWPRLRLATMPRSRHVEWIERSGTQTIHNWNWCDVPGNQGGGYNNYDYSIDSPCQAANWAEAGFNLSASGSGGTGAPTGCQGSESGGDHRLLAHVSGPTRLHVQGTWSGSEWCYGYVWVRNNGISIWNLGSTGGSPTGGSGSADLMLAPGTVEILCATPICPALWPVFSYGNASVSGTFTALFTDCNSNSVPDDSDISSATSPDRDANGVPDECQTVRVPGDYATIQAAIDAAATSTMRIVEVAAGTYAGPIDFKGKPVVVHGAGAGQTVLSGSSGQSLSVVRFSGGEPATAALEAVTVRGGLTGTPFPTSPSALVGGGVFAYQSAASIRDCIIEQNSAGFGGGLYEWGSTGKVERCTLRNNNSGADSGGAQALGGAVAMTDCLVQGNHSEGRGAGLHLVRGTPTLVRVQVIGNTSNSLMGGISWYAAGGTGSYLTIRDCTVTGNNATVNYGGIGITDTSLTVSTMSIQGTRACTNIPRPNIGGGSWTDLGGNTICDCVGDLTLEGLVNGADLGILLASWGVCTGACASDLNHDGVVNGADLGVLLNAWGTCGD